VSRPPGPGRGEQIRSGSAPLVALTGSSLALCCLVTVPDLALGWPALGLLSRDLAGWAGLGVVVAVVVAAFCLAVSSRIGAGLPLALGAVAAVVGLALSRDITSGAQLVLAMQCLAVAVGALFVSGLCMVDELAARWSRAAFVAWSAPFAGGWGLLGWLTLRARSIDRTAVGLHPPSWTLALAAATLVLWAVLTQLIDPPRRERPAAAGWESCWAALGTLVVGASSLVMLVAFQPAHTAYWVRPVVLLATVVGLVGLGLCGWLVPDPAVRSAYVGVVVALLCGPTCLHLLLLVSSRSSAPLSWLVAAALAAAGLLGCWIGWRWAQRAVGFGLLLLALGTAAGWVMPAAQGSMLAAAAPTALGVACAAAAGWRLAARSPMGLRYVSMAGLAALLFGLVAALPITWALGAELTARVADARAGGRVLLGLTFALAVLGAAVVSVLPPDDPRVPARRSEGSRPTIRSAGGYLSRKSRMVRP